MFTIDEIAARLKLNADTAHGLVKFLRAAGAVDEGRQASNGLRGKPHSTYGLTAEGLDKVFDAFLVPLAEASAQAKAETASALAKAVAEAEAAKVAADAAKLVAAQAKIAAKNAAKAQGGSPAPVIVETKTETPVNADPAPVVTETSEMNPEFSAHMSESNSVDNTPATL